MPARIGDTRTPDKKEQDSKKAIYDMLTEEQQSWGTLGKVAKQKGISSATLTKYLKQFAEEGIVIKHEEPSDRSRLPRTYYRLTSQKPVYGKMTEREVYILLKKAPSIQFTEEEELAWGYMDTAVKIFAYDLAYALASSSQMEIHKATKYIETIFQVRLKESLLALVRIFQRYKHVKSGTVPIASFAAESFMIAAEESAENWVPKDWLEKFGGGLPPEPAISIAWHLLTSRSEKEALRRIEEEIDEVQRVIAASYKQRP
jgi:DNA-binding MarR family transcriptional regulator